VEVLLGRRRGRARRGDPVGRPWGYAGAWPVQRQGDDGVQAAPRLLTAFLVSTSSACAALPECTPPGMGRLLQEAPAVPAGVKGAGGPGAREKPRR